jgi:hypothetical protein
VPRREELPDDCSEIFLRDHPEFLRKVRKEPGAPKINKAVLPEVVVTPELPESEDIPLGDISEDLGTAVPIDTFEPLQVLCSLEEKIKRKSEALRRMPAGRERSQEKSELLGYKQLIRGARTSLDDKLRERLHSVTDQLTDTKDQIARAALAVRVGEYDYVTYQRHVTGLRQRRDRLARRRANLAGWLQTQDPYLAGGFRDVSFDDIPVDAAEVTFPLEEPQTNAPINQRANALRDALVLREQADTNLQEIRRMKQEGALSDGGNGDPETVEQACAQRARAAVAFARDRLNLLSKDLDDDNKAIKAHLELARRKVEAGEMTKAAYQGLEVDLLQAQSDNNRARALAERALNANTSQDVPNPGGSFVNRMAAPGVRARGLGLDSWVAWVAAAVLVVNIFAPISNNQQLSTMALLPGMVTGLFVSAILLAFTAAIPFRTARGILLNVIWVGTTLAMAYTVNEARFLLGPVGEAMRSDSQWFTAPGIMLLLLGALVMGLAASVSLVNTPGWRRLPPFAALFAACGIALLLTNYGGAMVAHPVLDEAVNKPAEEDPSRYASIIVLRNDGWRPLWIGEEFPRVPAPVTFMLERRIGENSWEDQYAPVEIKEPGLPWRKVDEEEGFPRVAVAKGEAVRFRYLLPAGAYKARVLAPDFITVSETSRSMTLAPLQDSAEEPDDAGLGPQEVAPLPEDPGTTRGMDSVPLTSSRFIELRGAIDSAQRTPRFVLVVTEADGTERRNYVDLGGEVVSGWRAEEYNPALQSLTLSNGEDILVLNSGESVPLP